MNLSQLFRLSALSLFAFSTLPEAHASCVSGQKGYYEAVELELGEEALRETIDILSVCLENKSALQDPSDRALLADASLRFSRATGRDEASINAWDAIQALKPFEERTGQRLLLEGKWMLGAKKLAFQFLIEERKVDVHWLCPVNKTTQGQDAVLECVEKKRVAAMERLTDAENALASSSLPQDRGMFAEARYWRLREAHQLAVSSQKVSAQEKADSITNLIKERQRLLGTVDKPKDEGTLSPLELGMAIRIAAYLDNQVVGNQMKDAGCETNPFRPCLSTAASELHKHRDTLTREPGLVRALSFDIERRLAYFSVFDNIEYSAAFADGLKHFQKKVKSAEVAFEQAAGDPELQRSMYEEDLDWNTWLALALLFTPSDKVDLKLSADGKPKRFAFDALSLTRTTLAYSPKDETRILEDIASWLTRGQIVSSFRQTELRRVSLLMETYARLAQQDTQKSAQYRENARILFRGFRDANGDPSTEKFFAEAIGPTSDIDPLYLIILQRARYSLSDSDPTLKESYSQYYQAELKYRSESNKTLPPWLAALPSTL